MSEVVKLDKTTTEVDVAQTTDVAESHGHDAHHEPSVIPDPAWGWVGESTRMFRIAGLIVAAMLLLLIIGNHTGKTEDIFLVGFAVFILLIIFKDWALNRMSLRQK